jgi:hypothetical protein
MIHIIQFFFILKLILKFLICLNRDNSTNDIEVYFYFAFFQVFLDSINRDFEKI